jgi:alkylation response protein AidB-like acyl-CoA dehydrogenase
MPVGLGAAGLADLHDELRAVARDLLGLHGPEVPVALPRLAEPGWLSLEVPEALDGAGATFAEVAVVLEELGRAATASAFLGTAVLGVGALNAVEPGAGRDELLRAVGAGELQVAVALTADVDDAEPGEPPFRVERSRLHGTALFVPDALDAGRLLVRALDRDGVPVLVDVDPAGLVRTAQPVLDATRSLAHVTAEGVEVPAESVWRFAGDPAVAGRRLFDRAAVALAGDSLGLSAAMLDATVAYAGIRHQFGRAIGSFQAVKHACADMLVKVEMSRRLVAGAVRALVEDDSDASVAASMAKSYAGGAAVEVVGAAMQLHGGIGYTWESGIHAYLKRATLDRALFGSPAAHRALLAARYR